MVKELFGSYEMNVTQGRVTLPDAWKPRPGETLAWALIEERRGDRRFWYIRVCAGDVPPPVAAPKEGDQLLQSGRSPVFKRNGWPLPPAFLACLRRSRAVALTGDVTGFTVRKADEAADTAAEYAQLMEGMERGRGE